jgi:hypothetical protein
MNKYRVEKQLKKYMTYSVKNDEFTLNADDMSGLADDIVKLFVIPVVSNSVICECGNEMFKVVLNPYCCDKCGKRK